MTTATAQQDRVLSTLNADGSRRWLKPRLSRGRFLTRRRITAYFLIALFTLLPYIQINGKPAILLGIVHRKFTILGATFLPTDTVLLALFMLSVFVTVFLLTALFGRVWCGWACPQTVYMEFVYRPIERLLEGAPGHRKKTGGWRTVVKYVLYLLVSMYLAHTFLAYFVGVEALRHWILGSPANHPVAFVVMAAVTGLMMFDFALFREQTCIVACPYGRFQSVLLDRQSLIVGYDQRRGEPRGKLRRRPAAPANGSNRDLHLKVVAEPAQGDCIDCHLCVTTCPTGIDIRDGLQMECINCTQCIDACDAVMDKIGRPRGLIRYSSQAGLEGESLRVLRPRTLLYPAVLTVLVGLLAILLATKAPADITLLRTGGTPYIVLADGRVANQLRVKITNRVEESRFYTVTVDGAGASLLAPAAGLEVAPGATRTEPIQIVTSPEVFSAGGRVSVEICVRDDAGFRRCDPYRLLGPFGAATPGGPQ